MIKYENQIKEINNYNIYVTRQYSKKKGNKYTKHCDDILTFDIEVTSAWINKENKIVGYEIGHDNEYWNELTPLSLPYLWQFSFNDKVYYGRELKDFTKVLDDLPKDVEIVIWIHNLSYEFHFLNNFLTWKSVFARTPHKPMKCVSNEYPNIEFRCSYMLTRLSLDAWGKQIGVKKMVGDLDYEKIRTPLTPLTEKELNYGEQDCLVVYNGIKQYKERYQHIKDIPLTQTGTVRKVVKDLLTQDKKYVKFIKRLIPKSVEEYKMLMEVFSGGYTHANRVYSGQTILETVQHYDFASSYPTVMVCEKFPMSVWKICFDKTLPDEWDMESHAFIMRIHFKNIYCVKYNTYIQASKCNGTNMKMDNGRVMSADELELYMTEQDWKTIKECYKWEDVKVIKKYSSRKEYLPLPFIKYILELYGNKTSLKGVEGMEDLYMQSKQYINSLFGMSVTAIVQPDVEFNGTDWSINKLTTSKVKEKLDKLRDTREREKRYFLSYSWGCWVTAYARRNLWKCILSCDREVLYCDTDSIFVRGEHNFDWYNKEVTEKLRKSCEVNGLNFALTRPKTPKGKEKPLGIFDREPDCYEFRTLGAKRYIERRSDDNKLHLTVSGINKDAVAMLQDDIDNFDDGFNFDKDSIIDNKIILGKDNQPVVKKRLSTYVTDMPKIKYPDGYVSTYKEGINMRRTGYLLTMTDEYKDLIKYTQFDINNLPEHVVIRLKSYFSVEE